jgi:adenylosuccinate lyase
MGARLTDSALYAHLWGTAELRAIFDEPARLQSWLDILAALARAQAELAIIPQRAADAIAAGAVAERLDLAAVAEETRRTGHSTLGLIRGLQALLPAEAWEWVYYGATVQDLTDTWTSLACQRVAGLLWRDLRAAEARLLILAAEHRDTVMVGRTHGQPGAPITFGLKAAGWADELGRHLDRLREAGPRVFVGQLGGGVGTLGFFGEQGGALRERFCALLGLGDPRISWTSARDRLAEFSHLLAMIAGTAARIGNEVYQLSRPEIGELAEARDPGVVGSITMPHKANPERSEHLVTLARLARAQAGAVLEGMVAEGERDAREWKAEWVAVPEVCLLAGTAAAMARGLLDGLSVDAAAMARNAAAGGGMAGSEVALAALARRVGPHTAQQQLQSALAGARATGASLPEALAALAAGPVAQGAAAGAPLPPPALPATGQAGAMVDGVLARAAARRAAEPQRWP